MTSTIFSEDANGEDQAYLNIRHPTNEILKKAHDLCESLWLTYEHYADRHFRKQLSISFYERFWEMDLTCAFLEKGFEVQSVETGPDILLEPSTKRIWIEAVAPKNGTGEDAVEPPQIGVAISIPSERVMLRITSAIEEKYKKILHYKAKGIIANDEPCIIAINASQVDFSKNAALTPWIIKSVFAVGDPYYSFDRNTGKVVDQGIHYKGLIKKKNGESVNTTYFLNSEYSEISGILYSSADCCNRPTNTGEDYILVHNPFAANKLPRNEISFGQEVIAKVEAEEFELEWI